MIALGTPRELVASLGAEQVVFFALDGAPLAEGALAELESAVRCVRPPRAAGQGYELYVAAAHEAVPALLAVLDRRGARLTELRTHLPTLEDVFVSLTGRALRDG